MNRNNNPGNVKWADPNDHTKLWRGSNGYDARGHAIFEDPADGARALNRNLDQYWRHGRRTPKAICELWADAGDTQGSLEGKPLNDPREYARFIAVRAGAGIDEDLPAPWTAPKLWMKIAAAMTRYEMGEECPRAVIEEGYFRWYKDFIDKPEEGAKP